MLKVVYVINLSNFLDTESQLGGCLEEIVPGVEATTGACGHGLSIGVGMAISLKIKKQKAQKVFVIVGDGEHGEGSVWEAAICASRHNLDNLCIIIDYNKNQIKQISINGGNEKILFTLPEDFPSIHAISYSENIYIAKKHETQTDIWLINNFDSDFKK